MNLDLTEAIEAAIRANEDEIDRQNPDLGGVLRFDELEPDEQASLRAWAEAVVTAVAPLIAAQVAEQIAAAILADRTDVPWNEEPHMPGIRHWIDSHDATKAARIAREWGVR